MKPFHLASREYCASDTVITIASPADSVMVGEGYCTVIAGPCAVENRTDYIKLAIRLKELGADILRGGLFKPRTSPYSFQGLGRSGVDILVEARAETGLPVITEIMDIRDLDILYANVDILQVGSRNMQNYSLLEELGRLDKPVMIKRGLSATIEEWLLAAEYVLKGGNRQIILCERGIRTFETYTRNTVDIGAVPLIKQLTHCPLSLTPAMPPASGKWLRIANAAIAAGADGVMVEVHQDPDHALSDGKQSLTPENFAQMRAQLLKHAQINRKQPSTAR